MHLIDLDTLPMINLPVCATLNLLGRPKLLERVTFHNFCVRPELANTIFHKWQHSAVIQTFSNLAHVSIVGVVVEGKPANFGSHKKFRGVILDTL